MVLQTLLGLSTLLLLLLDISRLLDVSASQMLLSCELYSVRIFTHQENRILLQPLSMAQGLVLHHYYLLLSRPYILCLRFCQVLHLFPTFYVQLSLEYN